MLPSEPGNHMKAGPEKFNTAAAQDKDFKIVIMNMFQDFQKDMNKSIN